MTAPLIEPIQFTGPELITITLIILGLAAVVTVIWVLYGGRE